PASIADLDAAHRRQAHSAALIAAYDTALARLDGDAHAAVPRQIRQLQGELAGVQEHEPRLAEVDAMLDAAAIQVDEAGLLLERIRADLDVDPAQFDELERRITRLHELSRKHQVAPEGLAAQRDALAAELGALRNAAVRLEALDGEITASAGAWREAADALGKARAKAGKALAKSTTALIAELGMG